MVPFKIKIIETPLKLLLTDVWFLTCNKKLGNSMISAWVGVLKDWPGDEFSKLRKLKYWERQFFLAVTFQ